MAAGRSSTLPLRMALAGLGGLVLLAPVAALVGGLVAGREGVLGALLGIALPALVLAVTAAAAWLTRDSAPTVLAAAVFGSYVVKLLLLLGVLAVLRGLAGYDRPVLGVTALLGLVLALVVESVAVTTAKQPYVEPVDDPATRPLR